MIDIGQYADARDNAGERAVIYARSNARDPRWGPEWQLQQCRSEARLRGILVVEEAIDFDAPAELDADRPGWKRVVSLIEAHAVDLVLSIDLARITRRWEDMPVLMALHRQHGVDFLSVQSIVRPADSTHVDRDDGPAETPVSP